MALLSRWVHTHTDTPTLPPPPHTHRYAHRDTPTHSPPPTHVHYTHTHTYTPHTQGITPALTILKEGLISGSPDEKEDAARVLVEVINLASSKTLSTGKVVMLIAGPLIRVLGDRYGWNVKVATLEALVQLVRKVGACV